MTRSAHRTGYTLLELLCVIAVLVILGAVILPTLNGLQRDTRMTAAADMIHGWCSEARVRAINDGQQYQLFVTPDGLRIRLGPDESEQVEQPSDGTRITPLYREDNLPDTVTLVPMMTGEDQPVSSNGWLKLATFRPDGTCRETTVQFQLTEPGVTTRVVTIRGLTGHVTVNALTTPGGPNTPLSGGSVP
jgi:prepilin-type N-terminal cleavage/methylation domain-containing protein